MADDIAPSVNEATIERTAEGVRPVGDGWFVVNVADLAASGNSRMGITGSPEPRDARFAEFGVNLRVLEPGQFNARYHRENEQEGFLVLSGECILVVEGEERRLRQWDFFRSPPGTEHIFVGAGDGPCAILMIGARPEAEQLHYPASEVAAKHGASAAKETPNPEEAYADWPGEFLPVRLPWPVE